jgi:hypothetical protein
MESMMFYSTTEFELQVSELMAQGYSEADARAVVTRQELQDLQFLDQYFARQEQLQREADDFFNETE